MNEQDRAFLELFPDKQKSHVANLFLRPVRQGRSDPTLVFAAVYADLRERVERAEHYHWDNERDAAILATVRDNYDAATAYARWCVAYERLTPDEKRRYKARREAEALGNVPATERQIAYLRGMGYAGPVDNMRHASGLIDVYKRGGRVEVGGAA